MDEMTTRREAHHPGEGEKIPLVHIGRKRGMMKKNVGSYTPS